MLCGSYPSTALKKFKKKKTTEKFGIILKSIKHVKKPNLVL